jgi:hypothetical protein
MFKKE